MNHDMAAKIMMSSNISGQDSRIAAIENAAILARAQINDDWEIQVRHSDELDGHHVNFIDYNGDFSNHLYSYISDILFWSCYYKNGKFMFAHCGNSLCTNIIEDYYKASDGKIYNGYDRINTIFEVTGFSLENNSSDYRNIGYYFELDYSARQVEHYYDTDGSITSQSEETFATRCSTNTLFWTNISIFSSLAIIRSDYQTYLNDLIDFCYSS